MPKSSSSPDRIGVFRALQLGDLLCASPALRALRRANPHARILLIGLPWARSLPSYYPGELDGFIEFPGYPGLKEREPDLRALPAFLSRVQEERFELMIQLHGNGVITNPLVSLFGAKRTAGYYQPGQHCPCFETFLPYPDETSEVWRHLRLMEHLGFPPDSDRLSFTIPEEERRLGDRLLEEARVREPYVCLHPGTRAAWRCWPPEAYAALGDALSADGYTVLFTGSPAERPLASDIIGRMRRPATNLAGKTARLGLLAAILAGARLLVCGDTGVSHLACALGTASVVIFMRSEREGWPPSDRKNHRVVSDIRGVPPERVFTEARELLEAAPYPPSETADARVALSH